MNDGVTRRTASKLALGGLVTAQSSSTFAQASPFTILAAAIGPTYKAVIINDPNAIPTWVRKYINGFVGKFPYILGRDYTIDYRECPAAELDTRVFTTGLQAGYILCLSTTVVKAAAAKYPDVSGTKQIIGIVSKPPQYTFHNQTNVFGASAGRSANARFAYRKFLESVDTPSLASATVLYDPNYAPSIDALQDIKNGINPNPPEQPVRNLADIQNWVNRAPEKAGALLLPVDWIFGSANEIIPLAISKKVLDFWFVTDWVVPTPAESAFGGYGVPQEASGGYLAGQLEAFLSAGARPNPPWRTIPNSERAWKVSRTRAAGAGVTLPLSGPDKVP